jgi:predicted transcriptional regulator
MTEANYETKQALITLTTDIVSAHLSNNSVPVDAVPGLITSVYAALANLGGKAEPVSSRPEPAVSIRASVKPDYLICLEDGKKLTMLKRYLRTNFNMSPEEYRARWNLPADYPMVAPNYAEKRRELAKKIGLGRKAATPRKVRSRKSTATP